MTAERGADPPARRLDLVTLAPPLAFGAAVFAPMLANRFWRDDHGWVARAMTALREPGAFLEVAKTDFRPLPALSFMANVLMFGLAPAGYYATNLLLHLACVALVTALAWRLSSGDRAVAWIAGLLFAGGFGHYGEAVIWISGRTGLIADLFVLASVLAFDAHLLSARRRDAALAALFALLALLAKESAAVLPLLLVLVAWTRVGETAAAWRRARAPIVAVTLLVAAHGALVFGALRRGSGIVGGDYALGPHVVRNLLEYLARLFLPVTPSSIMVAVPAPLAGALRAVQVVLMVAVPVAGLALLAARVPRAAKFGVLWAPAALAPYLLLTFRTITRYLYLPSAGVAVAIGALAVTDYCTARARRWGYLGLAAVLLLEAATVQFVIVQRRREQLAQDPAEMQALVEHARALGFVRR